jgi:beta-glucosidase
MTSHIDSLLDRASVEELVALTAGRDFWHTVPIPRLGIPEMRVTDGPVGARGTRFDGEASICAPCSTLLAATWDTAAVERIGELLGRETKAKGASVLLAPTVNMHRTPVGGRNFECMSEDPYLTSRVAVHYVRGLQAEGVASCIKHFVGNDTEFERNTIDSRVDERTLREVYLRPFEAAVTEAGVMAVMTAYNRINGPWAADSPLLADVLRGEWGFDGLVMSDWFGLHSTVEGAKAGVDLEMPGPTLHRGERLLAAIEAGEVSVDDVRALARRVLELMDRTGALHADGPGPETTRHDLDDIELVRRTAAEGMVLLRNVPAFDASTAATTAVTLLPLQLRGVRRVAIIGPNAALGEVMGGGSAHVTPTSVSTPLDALRAFFEAAGVDVVHAPGCQIHRRLPEVDLRRCSDVVVDIYDDPAALDDSSATPVSTGTTGTTRLMWVTDPTGQGSANPRFGVRLSTTFTPDISGVWKFGVESVSPARFIVDGVTLIDNVDVPVGGSFFGMGRGEEVADAAMVAGRGYSLVVEMRHAPVGTGMGGINIGALAPATGDLLADAIDLAATADLSILIVGTNDNWESEGWDRTTLDLPGAQDALVAGVAQVSPATVVVVNAGSPISMPWLNDVHAVLVSWFPGQEMGNALVDLVSGVTEPQGRLPVTFPRRLEDTPGFEHNPGRNGVANYLEGRLMGHHWYTTVGREPLFPFGFGLGYGCADITDVVAADAHAVECTVSNVGDRDAVEVVQVYAHLVDRDGVAADEPEQRLVGFAKVPAPAGSSQRVSIALDPHGYRRWDIAAGAWATPSLAYELRIGRSATDIVARLEVRS